MLGLSLPKILFTIVIIAAVWYGFKLLGRAQEQRDKAPKSPEKQKKSQDADYEDLVACKICGDFGVAKGRPACGRSGCPHGK